LSKPQLGSRPDTCYRTVSEGRVIEILQLAGWAFELEAGRRTDITALTTAALQTSVELGLGYEISGRGERLFDPVEVVNHLKWAGLKGLNNFWINRFVATGRGLVREWHSTVGEATPAKLGACRFSVRLRRTFDLRRLEPGAKVRLRIPVPLQGSSMHEVEVSPNVPARLSARVSRQNGRLDVVFAAPVEPIVEIGADMCFSNNPSAISLDFRRLGAFETEVYLRPNEGLVRTTSRIYALSQSLCGPEKQPWEIVTAAWNYMIDDLICGMVHYDQVSVDTPCDWVLDSGWYDCQLGSALFVSLCRSRGIPARIMSGHLLYRLAPTNHFWAEAWINGRGWIPFDFLSWDLSEGGRDTAWRNHFFGIVDYRMVTQCLPLAFTGPMSIRFPNAWHMIQTRADPGIDIRFTDLEGGLIYSDQISVQETVLQPSNE
jgi:hypothetical protein